MTSTYLLKKYFWLLQAFQSGPITKEEIDSRWAHAAINEEHSSGFPKSTFFHMKNEIESLFHVSIECNSKGEYMLKESFREADKFHQWLISSLAVDSTIDECNNLQGRIMYESIPGGTQFLHPVVEAMKNGYRVIICYGSFKHAAREFLFSPYALRVYKQRWYAIGESSDHPGETRTYAFDRFTQVSTTNTRFTVPKGFDVEKYFAHVYGMTNVSIDEVQDIVVRVAKEGVPYLRTLPLHASQKEIKTTEQYSDFQFHLAPNFEFTQEILSRGAEAEVLAPASFRDRLRSIISAMHNKYEE